MRAEAGQCPTTQFLARSRKIGVLDALLTLNPNPDPHAPTNPGSLFASPRTGPCTVPILCRLAPAVTKASRGAVDEVEQTVKWRLAAGDACEAPQPDPPPPTVTSCVPTGAPATSRAGTLLETCYLAGTDSMYYDTAVQTSTSLDTGQSYLLRVSGSIDACGSASGRSLWDAVYCYSCDPPARGPGFFPFMVKWGAGGYSGGLEAAAYDELPYDDTHVYEVCLNNGWAPSVAISGPLGFWQNLGAYEGSSGGYVVRLYTADDRVCPWMSDPGPAGRGLLHP